MNDSVAIPDRPGADVGQVNGTGEFLIEDFVAAMLYSRRDHVRTVELLVPPGLFDESWAARDVAQVAPADDISIQLHVTNVRQTWPAVEPGDEKWPWSQFPEFEVDGYVLDPSGYTGMFWVRLSLRTSDDRRLTEGVIYRLEPGEELGTAASVGML